MRKNFLRRILLLVAFVVLIAAGVSSVYSQDDAPYAYFYSRTDKAFITERADGTDRHILVPFDLKEDHEGELGINGAGWSPSGRWFAWETYVAGGMDDNQHFYVFDRQTGITQIIHASDPNGSIDGAAWSPVEDLLLTSEFVWHTFLETFTQTTRVYDPVTGTYVFVRVAPIHTVPDSNGTGTFDWLPNGQLMFIESNNLLHVIPIRGGNNYTTKAFRYVWGCGLVHAFTNGDIAFQSAFNELAIANPAARQVKSVVKFPEQIQGIGWSPNDQYALVITNSSTTNDYALWAYRRGETTAHVVAHTGERAFFCYDPAPWSPDSRYLALETQDDQLSLFSGAGDLVQRFSDDCPMGLGHTNITWATSTRLLFSRVCFDPHTHSVSYYYDVGSGSPKLLTPDVNLYRYGDTFKGNELVVNRYTLASTQLASTINPQSIDAVRWHPSGDWLFVVTDQSSSYQGTVRIASPDGYVSRDSATCFYASQACYGWMPE